MNSQNPKVIVVGAGNWGKNLVKNFYALGSLAGIAEVNPILRESIIKLYPETQIYSEFELALNSDVQTLVIATPAPSHYQLGIAALKAGKDLFIEKPMTLKTSEAKHLAEYAEVTERILMVGHLSLYQPAIAWMRDYLANGKAGKVFHVSTQRTKLGKVRREENVWWSFAPHDVSVVLDLLGNPQLADIKAFGHKILQTGIADDVHVNLRFTSGQTSHIHSSWYYPEIKRSTVVIAEKQMLVYDEVAQTVTIHNKTIDQQLNNQDLGSYLVDIAADAPLKLECQHFLDCISTRQRPKSDGWNGVAVVEILEKAQESMDV
jgi:predicted dehydrogenase